MQAFKSLVMRPVLGLGMRGFSSRIAGTTKFFDSVKGFGFIAPADGSPDVFVHQTNIKTTGFRSLGEGEAVEFVIEENKDTGKRFAVDVTGPGGASPKGAPRRVPGGGGGGRSGSFDGGGERRPRRSGGGDYERY